MKKRWIIWVALGVTAAAVAILFEPTHVVRGWLRGERFFAGRPTSYWSKVIRDDVGRFGEAVGLGFAQEPDPSAVPMLIELLEDEDDEVRFAACWALGANGIAARPAIPALLEMLGHSNLFYRRNASHTLALIGPDASGLNTLIEALKEEDPWVNYHAAFAVGKIGPQAKLAVPALRDLMNSKKAKEQIISGPSVDFSVGKVGDHTFLKVKGAAARLPGTGTVGYAAFWALLQIDPIEAKGAIPQ
jgi:HEAT repeat protein